RPNPAWPVRRAAVIMQTRKHEPDAAADLARCRGLSQGWRSRLLGE
ncbi:MAG: MOSC domain-containing protein, partial [Gemmatimonadales bacterium]|nr:MOSC domain-containing protein [Gemmatimonadales bacterium]